MDPSRSCSASRSCSVVDFAARVGELLAYRNYDPESIVNPSAMDWLAENHGSLPLDAHADFSPFNGGEPLGRIQRLGPGTLDQIRRALDNMRFALLAEEGAPTAAEVNDFSIKTRAAVSLFLDSEVPDHLRQQASECDDWCRELPDSIPLWDYLRHQRTRATTAEHAADALRKAAASFAIVLRELENLVRSAAPGSPAGAVKVIPSMEKLQPVQMKLPPLGRELQTWAAQVSGLLDAMKEVKPDVSIAPDGSMGRRLVSQAEMVRETIDSATRAATAALREVEPLLARVKPELQALEQVVGWREYMDMFNKARELEKKLADWGSAGVQAFFLANASGSFGPFQFEEPVDLGGTRVLARSLQRGHVDVINAVGQEVLGQATSGSITVVLGRTAADPGYETTFTPTERCDDLLVQLGFIQQQTVDALSQLQQPSIGARSWCGDMSALLADPQQQQNLREAHRKSTHRWKAISIDLALLSKFKERLATYNLVARMSEEVPRVRDLIAEAEKRLTESTATISMIMGKSSKDVGTDQFMVPPKYAKTYTEALHTRDQAKKDIVRNKNLLKHIARDLLVRTPSPRLCGRPEVPQFRVLAPIPDALAQLRDAMSDENIRKLIAALSEKLGGPVPFNPPPPPPVSQVVRPPEPAASPPEPTPPPEPEVSETVQEAPAIADSETELTPSAADAGALPAGAELEVTDENPTLELLPGEEDQGYAASLEEPAAEPAIEYSEAAPPQEEMIPGFFTEDAPAPNPGAPPGPHK